LAGVLLLMTSPSPLEDVAHRAPLEFIFGENPKEACSTPDTEASLARL
jgi:hypothetical protein